MLDTVLDIALGVAIGLPAGWLLRGMRYARRAADEAYQARRKVDEMTEDHDDDQGRISFPTLAMAVVVALAFLSTVMSGYAAVQSDQANDRTRATADCTQRILERTITAINKRTAYSDDQADARRRVLVTQADLVDALLNPEASTEAQVELARKYQRAVTHRLRLDDRNRNRRDEYPYPSPEEIRECS